MKISPVSGAAQAVANPNEGHSVSPDRLERAKAVALGQPLAPEDRGPAPDPQVERAQNSIKKIKMKTQRSTDRHLKPEELTAALPVETATEPVTLEDVPRGTPQSDIPAVNEQAQAASEATKPLSPQFAALAKQKRELQLERQKLESEKQALQSQAKGTQSLEEYRARIKANALNVLMEEGVTYDQLTEQILATNQESANFSRLESEIKALKEGFENQNKSLTEREAAVERQALAQIRRDADSLIAEGDDYEMVREAGYAPKVVELIHRTYKKSGELLDVTEAARLVENELLEESLKFARIKKVQNKLNPAPVQTKEPLPVKQDRPNTKIMRTLTNRDGASSISMSKRERAIAAMEGRLK